MEALVLLWDDMCRNTPDFSSPTWPETILKEKERRVSEGKDPFLNWEQVKKDIFATGETQR